MNDQANEKITRGQWMALTAALLGWLFDGAEMGVFSLVGRPALRDLLQTAAPSVPVDEARVAFWFGAVTALFLVGAATGGVLFGWLGDRIGRVRAMTLSVLTYAIFTGACGLAQTAEQIAVLRFIASLGMGGEWSLGVALVMEVWPNKSRSMLAGLIGAAANVGYLLIAVIGMCLTALLVDIARVLTTTGMSDEWVNHFTGNQGWRLLMISGTAPALLTFFIRLFVPESQRWQEETDRGAPSRWAPGDLLGVLIGGTGPAVTLYLWANNDPFGFDLSDNSLLALRVVGTLIGILIAAAGYAYPVIRYLQRDAASAVGTYRPISPQIWKMFLAAGLSGVALVGTWSSVQWAPTWADSLTGGADPTAKGWTQVYTSLGAVFGCVLAAAMGDWIGRRKAYALFCIASFGSILLLYQGNSSFSTALLASAFVAGFCTASFYGWLPLYLPELFPTSIRATGQGFGFNFGRILAAVGALQTGTLFKDGYALPCSIMSGFYLLGLVLIMFAPETRGKPLPE